MSRSRFRLSENERNDGGIVLLYIHRQFFTRVMTDNPNNPLESPFAGSVLATFRCAVTVLQVGFEFFFFFFHRSFVRSFFVHPSELYESRRCSELFDSVDVHLLISLFVPSPFVFGANNCL